ncbi:AAA family ATPase [Polyangium jinanense]|uniref:AAA family ATPase n=1 Tax=Polyangium jinanense TaxID=2829994 RepID=A0A9X4AS94_9BACT|nr:AAA family ATPase [Polyangium jinanense]MDC3954659.1 AAA family ATPase [Polyangium jinanense]MDC3980962.1 AAA family ATPase [Polyangium jinanense]
MSRLGKGDEREQTTLAAFLASSMQPPDAAARLSLALAVTLDELHRAGRVHGDLSPATIVVEPGSEDAFLTDSGPRSGADGRGPSREASLAYAAPERTRRASRGFDGRADLYSLGAVLYEMLTGAPPFVSADPLALAHAHLARAPVPVHERMASVPRVLSDIAQKLLAKAPVDRYQTGRALALDLERFLREGPEVAPFPLGTGDGPDDRRIWDKTFGREAEARAIAESARRAMSGAPELVLIVGPAGSGKSTLVAEARERIIHQGGLFVATKPGEGAAPRAPLAEVMTALARRALTEPEERLDAIRARLLEALDSQGAVLEDLAPDVALVLGKSPPLPELGAAESRRRVGRAVSAFLRVFCEHWPLVAVFFDDLDRADSDTLSILGDALAEEGLSHLLVLGAAHEEDTAPTRPLGAFLESIVPRGVALQKVLLGPLEPEDVGRIVADVLSVPEHEVAALARLLHRKSRGNPFLVLHVLDALFSEGLVDRDPATNAVRWDERRILDVPIPDDAARFVAERLSKLSPEARRVLGAAAVLGHGFEEDKLDVVLGAPEAGFSAALAEAIDLGMIVPGTGTYHFVHEKVREAARSFLEGDERARVHLAIGRAMRAEPGAEGDRLFEVAHHFREGASLLDDENERRSVVRLLFEAGRKAQSQAAFRVAVDFYDVSAALLSAPALAVDPAFAVGLFSSRAECAYIEGHAERAEALFSEALSHAQTPLERARVHGQRLSLRVSRGRYMDAIAAGREGLSELSAVLPERGAEAASLPAALAEIARLVGGRSPEDLARAPRIEDRRVVAQLDLLTALVPPTYIADQALYLVVVVRLVAACVEHGHADVAAYAYASYALMLAMILGDAKASRAFFDLAVLLEDRIENPALRGRTSWTIGACATPFLPVRRVLPFVERGLVHSLQMGDIPYVSYSLHLGVALRYWSADPLASVREAWSKATGILPDVRDPIATHTLTALGRMLHALEGRTQTETSFDGDDFDDTAFVRTIEPNFGYAACMHHALRTQLCLLHGDLDGALVWAERTEGQMAAGMWLYLETFSTFTIALTFAARLSGADEVERARLRERLAPHHTKLGAWVTLYPDHWLPLHRLVSAEIQVADGHHGEARELYDEAIEAARKNGFSHHEALACERAAQYYAGRGRPELARPYLEAAMRAYTRWGATAKVRDLEARHPDVFGGKSSEDGGSGPADKPTRLTDRPLRGGRSLDVMAIVRAAQAIAGEIDLDRLLERLLRTVLEVAGADRAALVLVRRGELFVGATLTVDGADVGAMRPLAEATGVAPSVVQYVARTRAPIVIGRGAAGTPFEADPHLGSAAPRSFLGLPLVHRDALSGVLYLENRLVEDAFSEDRVELLSLLSSQAAIALENAILLADVRRRTDDLARANDGLQAELLRRAKAEAERASFEQAMIEMQRARLAELSAPLVPITDNVMVIPLVGTVDAARAEDLLRVALEGASKRALRALIIDITGVRVVDSHVASRLLDTVRAVELLGAEVVITGIRGDVAQALVKLDIDFGAKVPTRSTLQAGIAYALSRCRR